MQHDDEKAMAMSLTNENMRKQTNRWMTIISLALVMPGALRTWLNAAG